MSPAILARMPTVLRMLRELVREQRLRRLHDLAENLKQAHSFEVARLRAQETWRKTRAN